MPRRNRNARPRRDAYGKRIPTRITFAVARTPSRGARRCPSGKVRFADERAALEALKVGRTRREREGRTTGITKDAVPVRAYECPTCGGGWHLTSARA